PHTQLYTLSLHDALPISYLRGLAFTLKTVPTPGNSLVAQKYLREAVRLDPKFALSWALLSYVEAVGYRTLNLQPTVSLREEIRQDRKSTRLNSSHSQISY